MVLQNKSDNSNGQWTCTKMVKFPIEFIILKMYIAETYPFSRKLPGKRKFLRNEISRNFAHFRIIFAFRENEKKSFRFNPNLEPSERELSELAPSETVLHHVVAPALPK
jgi:hypothetical protein